MTKYIVHQIQISDAEADLINSRTTLPKYETKLDLMMPGHQDHAMIAKHAMLDGYYTEAGNIEADGLEGAFMKGQTDEFNRTSINACSVSTGDLIVDTTDDAIYVVKSWGFEAL
jgi:hypothetical protein